MQFWHQAETPPDLHTVEPITLWDSPGLRALREGADGEPALKRYCALPCLGRRRFSINRLSGMIAGYGGYCDGRS
jgi:hypothetical protein